MKHTFQKGMGLIAVLVTVVLLATALLALAALQTRSLQYNSSAYLRSQANIIAYDLIEQVRISSSMSGAPTTPSEADRKALVADLPEGKADVSCDGRVCTVSITWTEPTLDKNEGANEKSTFSYQTRV